MRQVKVQWLVLLLAVVLTPGVSPRKLDEQGDGAVADQNAIPDGAVESKEDAGGFGFTFSPLSFFFGSDDDDDEEDKGEDRETGEMGNPGGNASDDDEEEEDKGEERETGEMGNSGGNASEPAQPADTAEEDGDTVEGKNKLLSPAEAEEVEKVREEEKELRDGGKEAEEPSSDGLSLNKSSVVVENGQDEDPESPSKADTVPNPSSLETSPSKEGKSSGKTELNEVSNTIPKMAVYSNTTGIFLVNDLEPETLHPRRHHRKRHHKHSPGLDHVMEPASGKNSHLKARADNSSMLSDRSYRPTMPMMSDLNRYMANCENCLVEMDSYQCPMSDMALELKKWMTELEELITYGCQNGDMCDRQSKCCHRRDPAMERAMGEMTELARQMFGTFSDSCTKCPLDGGWSEWCEWGSCSVSCGNGVRMRTRRCNNPSPKGGGRDCDGPEMDTIPCSGPDCCINGNWSPWSSWGRCGVTCGQGMQDRTRSCDSPPPNWCGLPCPGSASDMKSCDTGVPCCIDGNWSPWSTWSSCPVTCGSGTVERRRSCDSPSPNYCGQRCPGADRDTQTCYAGRDCCVDGNWGPWEPWGTCSGTCGIGLRTRRRRCDSPTPNFCGRPCPGESFETDSCDTGRDCCIDGNWSPWSTWSSCPVTCGSGTVERRRSCDNPSPNYCGQRCPGADRDARTCYAGRDCCESDWTPWGSWERCSVSCGRGERERRRRCDRTSYLCPPCPGPAVDTEPCQAPACLQCIDGNWGSWLSWGSCSVNCGTGIRTRIRRCDNPPPNVCGQRCPGSASDTAVCETGRPCCVDGNWGSWQTWSGCTRTCGGGVRNRQRQCDSPAANYCGRPCPGRGVEQDDCNTNPCPPVCRDVNWSPWSPWSECSASCGLGTRERSRTCVNPNPPECVRTCPGPARDTTRCELRPCCVDGNWGPWGPWGGVTVTCGVGQRSRRRQCDNPRANYCGQPCPGPDFERDDYDTRVPCICQDGNWSPWGAWSRCSVTCGEGMELRERTCSNPPPDPRCGGRECTGPSRDTRRCTERDCCVDGNWGPWGSWSGVTVTCGVGQRSRRRQCDNPRANYCGQPCPGPDFERDDYDTGVPCVCRDGNWSPWGAWSRCSVTCGQGMETRERTCSNPPPDPRCGGRECGGPSRDTRRCTERDCCVDGNWGPWAPWSGVTVTCGVGQRSRRRQCDNPRSNYCGQPCPGPDFDRDDYDTGVPCVCQDGNWSPWGAWSRCSVTCGEGMESRERTCSNPPPDPRCGGRQCAGSSRDTRRCTERDCCVDGNWGPWAPWSGVTVTCGVGQRSRRRQCDNPRANYCGQPCPGPDFDRDDYDTGVPCVCQDGNWSPWGAWSRCSVTCGQGMETRERTCSNPPPDPRCGGRECGGPSRDTRRCTERDCCVDGNWGPWAPWSGVTVTCGVGQRSRRRQCDSPRANYCGQPCPGPDFERDDYDTRVPCTCRNGNWGEWGPWDQCTLTCGTGQQLRRRYCDNPPADPVCGIPCPGPAVDSRACTQGPCCAERQWSTWSRWSACDVSCGQGTRSRTRLCQPVSAGQDCGNTCPGPSTNYEPCPSLPACGPDCGPWSACSVTCAGWGVRERVCRFPGTAGLIGGSRTETERCQLFAPECPPEAGWGAWEGWCPCDCKDGQQSRRRSCRRRSRIGLEENVPMSLCGPGDAREKQYCDVRDQCPLCVTDCTGRRDGDYPSCTSCRDYIRCTNGELELFTCSRDNYVYDAFTRMCVTPPSPSCSLRDCLSSCMGVEDGLYHSCFGCNQYVECRNGRDTERTCPFGEEFNAHSGKCDVELSPTCKRAIRRRLDLMPRDAPADTYFETDALTEEERQEKYLELRKKAGVAAKYNREDEDVFRDDDHLLETTMIDEETKRKDELRMKKMRDETTTKEEDRDDNEDDEEEEEEDNVIGETTKKTQIGGEDKPEKDHKQKNSKRKDKEPSCRTDCSEVGPGMYQSCRGCRFYLICTKHGVARLAKCPRNKLWDDKRKKCKKHSRTCKEKTVAP